MKVYQTPTCVRPCYRHKGLRGQLQDFWGFPGSSDGKVSACNAGDLGSIPGLGRSPGEGHGNPLQYSCLENPMDRGAWWATVHRVAKSQTRLSTERLTHINTHCFISWRFIKGSSSTCVRPCGRHRGLRDEWVMASALKRGKTRKVSCYDAVWLVQHCRGYMG